MFALNAEGNFEGSVKIRNKEKGCLGFRMKTQSSGSPTYMISSGGVGVLRPRSEKIVKVTVPAGVFNIEDSLEVSCYRDSENLTLIDLYYCSSKGLKDEPRGRNVAESVKFSFQPPSLEDEAETSKSRTRRQLAFPCEVEQCDRAFASHQKMVTHCLKKHSMVIHVEFCCDICHKKVKSRRALMNHKKKQHHRRVVAQSVSTCETCNAEFKSEKLLAQHLKRFFKRFKRF